MSHADLPATVADVPTPCLLVDLDKVKRNCQKMRDTANRMGVALRPHMKTHKTIEAGVIATNGTKRGIAVSTLNEADFYADNGFDDILWARPFSRDKTERCIKVAGRLDQFHVMYDSQEGLEAMLEAKLDGDRKWSACMEIDTGYGRTGVNWDSDDVVTLAKNAVNAGVNFLGIYTHCGESYDCHGEEELKKYGSLNASRLVHVKNRIEDAGVKCPMVGTGSTPSCTVPDPSMATLTEFHPGNYVFYDMEHVLIGACAREDVAVRVATRIIGHKPYKNQVLVDCGFTAISHDGIVQLGDKFCEIQNHPNLRLLEMSQEIGKVRPAEGKMKFDKYPIGKMLFIFPYHSCATAANHQEYYVHSGEKIVGVWKPNRGW